MEKMDTSFYRMLVQDFHSQLRIPPAFANQFGFLAKEYLLDGPQSLVGVSAEKSGIDWYFRQGWARFAQEHSLEYGDFLFFQYDAGNETFHVKVYGKSLCEKDHEIVPSDVKGKGKRAMRGDQQCDTSQKATGMSESGGGGGGGGSKLNDVEAAAAKFVSESQYPAFHKVMTGAYIEHGYLSIPAQFHRRYMEGNSDNGEQVRLKLSGTVWYVEMNIPEGRTGRLSSGWAKFRSDNALEVEEALVFELMDTQDILFKITRFSTH